MAQASQQALPDTAVVQSVAVMPGEKPAENTAQGSSDKNHTPVTCLKMLEKGYMAALVMTGVCLGAIIFGIGALMIFVNLKLHTIIDSQVLQPHAIAAAAAMIRLSLITCGVIAGMCTIFLGFALFMMGISGAMDVRGQGGPIKDLQLNEVAPGTLIMLFGAVLVGFCAVQQCPLTTP